MSRIKFRACLLGFIVFLLAGLLQAQERKVIRIADAGIGYAGFLKISLWLADNLSKGDDVGFDFWWNYPHPGVGKGFRNGLLLLGNREAEIALVNSPGVAAMALRGRGLFQQSIPVRAIAAVPQPDSISVFAVDANLGIKSFADLREKRVPIKLATGYSNEIFSFLAHEILKRHGIDPEELKRRGGEIFEAYPRPRLDPLLRKADAFFYEGGGPDTGESHLPGRKLSYLSIEPKVSQEFEEEYGWKSVTIPANSLPDQNEPVVVLDFSDWLICVREDMDEKLAYRLAQIVWEQRQGLENNVLWLSPAQQTRILTSSPGRPIDPLKTLVTSIPLHAGAARYYRERGLLSR